MEQHDREVQAKKEAREQKAAKHAALRAKREEEWDEEIQIELDHNGNIDVLTDQPPLIQSLLQEASNSTVYYEMVMVAGGAYPPVNTEDTTMVVSNDNAEGIAVGITALQHAINADPKKYALVSYRISKDNVFLKHLAKYVGVSHFPVPYLPY